MSKSDHPGTIRITRVFDAPRELVWRAFSEPEMLKRWWAPKTYSTPVCEMDFRVGGKLLSCMRGPEGNEIWGIETYQEIVPQERIVVTDSFADENGNVVPAAHYGLGEDFPLETRVSFTFEELDGKTRLTLLHEGHPAGELGEGAIQGWNEMLDKLAASLEGAA